MSNLLTYFDDDRFALAQDLVVYVDSLKRSSIKCSLISNKKVTSSLGMFFKIRHPDLYKRAGVEGLSAYLEKAAKHGIILVGKGDSPGSEWAELMPAYRGTVFSGSTY